MSNGEVSNGGTFFSRFGFRFRFPLVVIISCESKIIQLKSLSLAQGIVPKSVILCVMKLLASTTGF